MLDTTHNSWTPRVIYRAMFRFKWRAIGFFVLVVTTTILGLIVCPRTYRSEAKLFLRIGRESIGIDPTATAAGRVTNFDNSRESEINSVIEVLTSRPIMEQVVDARLEGETFESPLARDKALRKLMKSIEADSPTTTSVIVVTAEDTCPKAAQRKLQALIDAYREEHMRVHRTSGSHEFFQQQSVMLRQQLEAATERLRDAKNEYGFVSLEERKTSLQQQIGELETQMRLAESEMTASGAKVGSLRSSLDKMPAGLVGSLTGGDDALVHLRRELFELQAREQELLSKRTEDHPQVIALREQMRELKEIFDGEKIERGAAMSAVVLQENSQLKSHEARHHKLIEQHQQMTAEFRALNEQELQVDKLKREVDLLAANYQTYSESLEQSRVDEALQREGISNVTVVQPASYEPKPSSPRKGITLVIAGMLGLCGGLGLALVSEQLDQSLRFGDDIERRLQLPLLATIPQLKSTAAA